MSPVVAELNTVPMVTLAPSATSTVAEPLTLRLVAVTVPPRVTVPEAAPEVSEEPEALIAPFKRRFAALASRVRVRPVLALMLLARVRAPPPEAVASVELPVTARAPPPSTLS